MRLCVLLLSAGAALMDLFLWKISNLWICFWIAAGFLARIFLLPDAGLWPAVLGLLLPLLLLGWLFYFRMMGAGDIKLFCALGVWTGADSLLNGMFVSFLIAGGFAAVRMLRTKNARDRFAELFRYLSGCFRSGVRTEYNGEQAGKARMHLALPVLLAMILWCLGVYT